MTRFAAGLLLVIMFSACEKTLDVKPTTTSSSLVVDGTIETGQPPIIFLSTSLNYFSKISPEILAASQVPNAIVTLSDGQRTHQLKAYNQDLGNGFNLIYYSIDTSNLATAIIGRNGSSYKLTIVFGGNTYEAVTSIPQPDKILDSLWFKAALGAADSNKVSLIARVSDPAGYGDYIRYFSSVNGERFLPGANSVYDDQIVDGSTYDIQVDQGIDRNDPPEFEDYGFFERGDTATIKFTNIDKSTFDFWRTVEYSYQSIGNPFSTPTSVINNIPGALGAFCGYSVQYKTLIIPK